MPFLGRKGTCKVELSGGRFASRPMLSFADLEALRRLVAAIAGLGGFG
jgi:hypothetical protein